GPPDAMAVTRRSGWASDAAFGAVAFAAAGHLDDAVGVLEYLQRVQGTAGRLEARYVPDGSGPPDGRLPQADGTGWAMWATAAVLDAAPAADRADLLEQFAPLREQIGRAHV